MKNKRMKIARIEHDMKQEDLAKAVGVTRQTIGMIELRKKLIEDERIAAQRRKIQSDACGILLIVLLVSTLVQQYVFDAPFSQYAVEFVCFVGASIYIVIRNIISGNDLLCIF